MEAFMRILASAIAVAVALAWPNVGEAQSKKSTARSTQTTQQKQATRKKTVRVQFIGGHIKQETREVVVEAGHEQVVECVPR